MITVGIITVSDKGSKGEREDKSGEVIKNILPKDKFEIIFYKIIPDEKEIIEDTLVNLCDNEKVDLILTTGGTGLAKRDITPEATKKVIEKEVPGISEAIRFEGFKITKNAVLSRGISGIRKNTLIINLPGSPKAVKESLETILPVVPHAIEILKGDFKEHL